MCSFVPLSELAFDVFKRCLIGLRAALTIRWLPLCLSDLRAALTLGLLGLLTLAASAIGQTLRFDLFAL